MVKCDFKLVFNNFTPYFKTDFYHKTTPINLKSFILYWIESFVLRGHKFCHINEMNITTISDKINMTHEQNIKQPIQAIELKLNIIIAKNPHLINLLNRFSNHPLIRKYSLILLNN